MGDEEFKNVDAYSTKEFQLHQVCRIELHMLQSQGHSQRGAKKFEWQNVMIFATSWTSQDSLNEERKNS